MNPRSWIEYFEGSLLFVSVSLLFTVKVVLPDKNFLAVFDIDALQQLVNVLPRDIIYLPSPRRGAGGEALGICTNEAYLHFGEFR